MVEKQAQQSSMGPQPPTKAQVSMQLLQAKQELQSQKEQFTKEAKKSSLPVPVHSVYIDRQLKVGNAPAAPSTAAVQPASVEEEEKMVVDTCSVSKDQSALLNEPSANISQGNKVYILVFKSAMGDVDQEIKTQSSFSLRRRLIEGSAETINDSYPFKSFDESIGILWDKDLNREQYKLFIELQQENRQKLKNAYYLEKLLELELISNE